MRTRSVRSGRARGSAAAASSAAAKRPPARAPFHLVPVAAAATTPPAQAQATARQRRPRGAPVWGPAQTLRRAARVTETPAVMKNSRMTSVSATPP